uniref:Fibrinogen C-terminal domain-containing protein n=1 Tax=Macrostomum lignano TaxID=282301 RepID=A0A1I8IC69_9PLAT
SVVNAGGESGSDSGFVGVFSVSRVSRNVRGWLQDEGRLAGWLRRDDPAIAPLIARAGSPRTRPRLPRLQPQLPPRLDAPSSSDSAPSESRSRCRSEPELSMEDEVDAESCRLLFCRLLRCWNSLLTSSTMAENSLSARGRLEPLGGSGGGVCEEVGVGRACGTAPALELEMEAVLAAVGAAAAAEVQQAEHCSICALLTEAPYVELQNSARDGNCWCCCSCKAPSPSMLSIRTELLAGSLPYSSSLSVLSAAIFHGGRWKPTGSLPSRRLGSDRLSWRTCPLLVTISRLSACRANSCISSALMPPLSWPPTKKFTLPSTLSTLMMQLLPMSRMNTWLSETAMLLIQSIGMPRLPAEITLVTSPSRLVTVTVALEANFIVSDDQSAAAVEVAAQPSSRWSCRLPLLTRRTAVFDRDGGMQWLQTGPSSVEFNSSTMRWLSPLLPARVSSFSQSVASVISLSLPATESCARCICDITVSDHCSMLSRMASKVACTSASCKVNESCMDSQKFVVGLLCCILIQCAKLSSCYEQFCDVERWLTDNDMPVNRLDVSSYAKSRLLVSLQSREKLIKCSFLRAVHKEADLERSFKQSRYRVSKREIKNRQEEKTRRHNRERDEVDKDDRDLSSRGDSQNDDLLDAVDEAGKRSRSPDEWDSNASTERQAQPVEEQSKQQQPEDVEATEKPTFFRNWTEYRSGFGDPSGEHFLGLDALAEMTSRREYQLWVVLEDWEGLVKHVNYDRFFVFGKQYNYKLIVDRFHGDASVGDSLGSHSNASFSTFDSDNDLVDTKFGGNCAKRFRGGFWYFSCYRANPTGQYYQGGAIPNKKCDGIVWKTWKGPHYSLKSIEMKIKPL